MNIHFYNTFTGRKEKFIPILENTVKMYSCGPTVYAESHIGNLRYFVFVDLLKRTLKHFGYDVFHVMNITDIEDKIIEKAKKENLDFKVITQKYEKIFFEDIQKLKCILPNFTPRATEEIETMKNMVKDLLKKGYAYENNGSVYFNIQKFPDYGKLSKLEKRELKPGARVDNDEYEKENPGDFALWKKSAPGEPSFEFNGASGRPAWHLECSAMGIKYLGEQFDMHIGGVDLVFPHHENEIAQSCAYTGKNPVKYWIHSEHLFVDGKKMSKSLGNYYVLNDILQKGHSPDPLRYLFLSTHYKTQLNFTLNSLKNAENTLKNLNMFIDQLKSCSISGIIDITDQVQVHRDNFFNRLYDDLDITSSCAAMFDMIALCHKHGIENIDEISKKKVLDILREFNEILDVLDLSDRSIPSEIEDLAKKRWDAKMKRDFTTSDEIRKNIEKAGYIIEDLKDNYIIRKGDCS